MKTSTKWIKEKYNLREDQMQELDMDIKHIVRSEIESLLPEKKVCHCETCVNGGRCPEWVERNQCREEILNKLNN